MDHSTIKVKGKITRMHSMLEYDVELENNTKIRARISGKMRVHRIRLLPGDEVDVEISTYDLTNGRIVYRRTKSFHRNPSSR